MPAYACSGCGREYAQPLERLVDMIRSGRTRCLMCGEELVFPDAARAALFGDGDAGRLEELRRYTCGSCNRTWATSPEDLQRRRRTGCSMCGAPLRPETLAALDSLAPERSEPTVGSRLQCLVCLRPTWIDSPSLDDVYRCQYCGAGLRLPEVAEQPARVPPLAEPAASREEVSAILRSVGRRSDFVELCGEVLHARSEREELGSAEARRLVAYVDEVERWRPAAGVAIWPLSLAEAEEAVPPVLFPGKPHHVERHSAGWDVVFLMSTSEPPPRFGLINAIGVATLVLEGAGVFVFEDEPAAKDQHRIRIALRSCGDRIVELALFTQISDFAPKAASSVASDRFGEYVSSQRELLLAYYGTLTLFGAWASGSTAAATTTQSIAERLEYLGLGSEIDCWALRLCMVEVADS